MHEAVVGDRAQRAVGGAVTPRFSRCRMVLPEEAWTGLAPHMAAKAASLWRRSGLSPAVSSSWAAVCTQALWRSSSRGAVRLSVLVMTASRLAIWSSRPASGGQGYPGQPQPCGGVGWAQARARWSLRSGRSRPCSSSSPSTSSARIWLVAWVRALIALRPGHQHQGAELSDGAVAGLGTARASPASTARALPRRRPGRFALAPPPGAVGRLTSTTSMPWSVRCWRADSRRCRCLDPAVVTWP
jgi:hypothetical protein